MKVNIGLLKNDLSKYLHKVRSGEEVTITDRNEPVAKIIPLEKPLIRASMKAWLKIHPPLKTVKKQPPSSKLVRALRDEDT